MTAQQFTARYSQLIEDGYPENEAWATLIEEQHFADCELTKGGDNQN